MMDPFLESQDGSKSELWVVSSIQNENNKNAEEKWKRRNLCKKKKSNVF